MCKNSSAVRLRMLPQQSSDERRPYISFIDAPIIRDGCPIYPRPASAAKPISKRHRISMAYKRFCLAARKLWSELIR